MEIIDIITVTISLCALLVSLWVGYKQIKISSTQAALQNKVEMHLQIGICTTTNLSGHNSGEKSFVIVAKNIGNSPLYMEKCIKNGVDYPPDHSVLPPASVDKDIYQGIMLPKDGSSHISFKLLFKDWSHQKWQVEGYSDLVDGAWKLSYEPCKKRGANT